MDKMEKIQVAVWPGHAILKRQRRRGKDGFREVSLDSIREGHYGANTGLVTLLETLPESRGLLH